MKRNAVIYLHGKGGSAQEAEHYRPLFADCEVIGFDYASQTPWEAREEFSAFFDALCGQYESVSFVANSIGAFFAMSALYDRPVRAAWFISPIVDMEALIGTMLQWAGVSEEALRAQGEIETAFGETLSWEYLSYVRAHPLQWNVPTEILYGARDELTTLETVSAFARRTGAGLTVMEGGEHWFHTAEQMNFLDRWLTETRGTLLRKNDRKSQE